jgi:NADPH:quinone reductase-like Zn-dependent oxidoreductase
VVGTSKDDLVGAVRDATDGTAVDTAVDTVGGEPFNSVIATLRDGGRSAVIASTGNPVGSLNVLELYRRFERTISGVDTGHMTLAKAARILDVLRRGFESGALHAPGR